MVQIISKTVNRNFNNFYFSEENPFALVQSPSISQNNVGDLSCRPKIRSLQLRDPRNQEVTRRPGLAKQMSSCKNNLQSIVKNPKKLLSRRNQ